MPKKTSIKTIAFLEDEKALARLYMNKLEEAGYKAKVFETADDLIDKCNSLKPDVAFLDQALHGAEKSGMDVIPSLRKCNPEMKIVILSNYSEFQMKKAAEKAGADDYLLKLDTPPAALVQYLKKL